MVKDGSEISVVKQTDRIGYQVVVPLVFTEAGEALVTCFQEFFLAEFNNGNTREAYGRAIIGFFDWAKEAVPEKDLYDFEPLDVVGWRDYLQERFAAATVELRISAVRSLFNWLVLHQHLSVNPAKLVKVTRERRKVGKTPYLAPAEARKLLDSIDVERNVGGKSVPIASGLRDRALICVMLFMFARISAAVGIDVKDVSVRERRLWILLREKRGKQQVLPCHHLLERYVRAYIDYLKTVGKDDENGALFRTLDCRRQITDRRLNRSEAWYMVQRRAKKAEVSSKVCNHTFRATGITAYLSNENARLEYAQEIAGHADPSTTLMYDRNRETIHQAEVERIEI